MADQIPKHVMTGLARRQRKSPVSAETVVWRALRDRRCGNFKFRRQVPVGAYIADFICFEKKLVVEIDGPSHAREDQNQREGFKVLRLPNDLVVGSPDIAIRRITEALNE
jgi:very-short-patch-repair endonuclease